MNSQKFTKDEMEKIVNDSVSIADVCRKCGWKPTGGNYRIIKKNLEEYNIDNSHFTGQRTNIGNKNNKNKEKKLEEYLTINSNISSHVLKNKLIKEKYKKYQCENKECGISKWHGKQISLQLHHINGNPNDNRLENLQLLCPNCHSLTETYCGYKSNNLQKRFYCKNCGKEIEKTKTGYCNECYDKLISNEEINVNISDKVITIFGYCSKCGVELHSKTKHGLCSKCTNKYITAKVKDKPTKEELQNLINEKSYEAIGKMYGVTGKCIKKWCDNLGIKRMLN